VTALVVPEIPPMSLGLSRSLSVDISGGSRATHYFSTTIVWESKTYGTTGSPSLS
jgi:hypothetical protein